MKNVLMSLGGFKFEVGKTSYDKISKNTEYRWNELKTIGGRSYLQFMGENNEQMSLSGVIYPQYSRKQGIDAYSNLKSRASRGKPQILVDARGISHGRWVVEGLSVDESLFDLNNTPKKIEFSITLKRFHR